MSPTLIPPDPPVVRVFSRSNWMVCVHCSLTEMVCVAGFSSSCLADVHVDRQPISGGR